MKYIDYPTGDPGDPIFVELTRHNLLTLLAKLDDPNSARTLIDPSNRIAVIAVEDEAHYTDRAPGITYTNGEYA